MAQAPIRPPVPQPAASITRTSVNIYGRSPEPDMAPEPSYGGMPLTDNTKAEMAAGKAALAQYDKRADAEYNAGRKSIARNNPVTQEE